MAEELGLYNIAPGETPQAVSTRRKMAEALMMQGMSAEPIRAWTQGAARIAQALIGGYEANQADKQDAEGVRNAMLGYRSAMGGDQPSPVAPAMPLPSAAPVPDMPRPPAATTGGVPMRNIGLDDPSMRPPQSAIVAALNGPGASPAILGPSGQPQTQPTASPQSAMAPQGAPQPQRSGPNPALIASLANPYLPKPLQELAMARAKEQMKPDEWTHFTAGDKNMVYNKTNPSIVRDLGASSENKFGNVAELRKEIHTLPSYKNWTQAEPIYRAMIDTQGVDSKASDLNLVYGLGKIFDPTSVVREGEMVMVRNTASLPDWLVGSINSLNGGARLTPDTRKAILNEARIRTQQYYDMVQQDTEPYRGIAKRFNMHPDDIIPPIRALPSSQRPVAPASPAMQGTTVAAPAQRPAPPGVDPKIWAAMTPQEQALWK